MNTTSKNLSDDFAALAVELLAQADADGIPLRVEIGAQPSTEVVESFDCALQGTDLSVRWAA